MRGGKCYAQPRVTAHVGQHHDDAGRLRMLGQVFGVAGEGDACIVDHALVHRRGDHRGELAANASL